MCGKKTLSAKGFNKIWHNMWVWGQRLKAFKSWKSTMYEYGLVYCKPSHLGSSNRNLHPCDGHSKEMWALIESGFQASWPLSSCLATLSIRSIPTCCSELYRAFLSLSKIQFALEACQSSRLNSMKRFELLESSLRSNWSSFSAPNWLSGYSGCRTSSCSRDCLGIVPANDGAWASHSQISPDPSEMGINSI